MFQLFQHHLILKQNKTKEKKKIKYKPPVDAAEM